MLVANQRGFAEAPAFVLLMLLAFLLAVLLGVWHHRRQQTREHYHQMLCLKRSMVATHRLVRRVNALNAVLVAGRTGQAVGLFFPGLGHLLALKWERLKKVVFVMQEAAWWDAQRRFVQLKLTGCRLPLKVYLTPYRHKLRFQRDLSDTALLRRTHETWHHATPYVRLQASWRISSPLAPQVHWSVR